MTNAAVWELVQAVLVSLGGGGIIVLSFSSWLGKVWANRLMASETARHSRELEELRSLLQASNDRSSHIFKEKIGLYKEVGEPLIALVTHAQLHGKIDQSALEEFELRRLSSTALLALFAPRKVFDSYNDVIDYIFDTIYGVESWSFNVFRSKALSMLSLMRHDVGLYQDDVSYSGHR